jgi:nucleoside 2-deoxyribosyltransferase
MKTVYLAGPITGCTNDEMQNWRLDVTDRLRLHSFRILNPCRPGVKGDEQAQFHRDCQDVRMSDIVLANLGDTKIVSIGTVMELMHAHDHGKHVVAIVDERHDHLFVRNCLSKRAADLPNALWHIIESYGGVV